MLAAARQTLVLSLFAIALLLPAVAGAASFTVDTTTDSNDASPGNGLCADSGGFCSLRASMQEANALAGADAIDVPAGTYIVTNGLPWFSRITMTGAGAGSTIIDGNGVVASLVYVAGAATAFSELHDVTVRGGYYDTFNSSFYIGAGIQVAPGASLAVFDSTVTENIATATGTGAAYGGGIASAGSLSLTRVTVSDNQATYAGGLYLTSSATTTIVESVISGNDAIGNATATAPVGGGIWSSGNLFISDSEITGNTANRSNVGQGGGLVNTTSSAIVTIDRSLIAGNGSPEGAALVNYDPGRIRVTNTTISGNTRIGTSGFGGAIENLVFGSSSAEIEFSNCTIASHSVGARTIHTQGSGSLPSVTTFSNTIIDNPGVNCTFSGSNRFHDSYGYNLVRDSTCALVHANDDVGSANLLALADNGGPTRTHALGNTSPALNAIPPEDCLTTVGFPVDTDQRGVGRPIQTNCEIGAYEDTCGNGSLESGEGCDDGNIVGGDCCTARCALDPTTVVCRATTGVCDPQERCTGTSAGCPADVFLPSTTACRVSSNICDAAEMCTGTSGPCPSNSFVTAGTLCRPSIGVCDPEETCTGTGAACPGNTFLSSSTVCRAGADVCDATERCTGSSGPCPADGLSGTTVICRAAADGCDALERCTGASMACPVDAKRPSGTACASDGNICTNDVCDGLGTCGVPNTIACNDGLYCTVGDTCADGTCVGAARDCSDTAPCSYDACNETTNVCVHTVAPVDPGQCFVGLAAKLQIADGTDPEKDKLSWQWSKGDAFTQMALGTPQVDTDYALCVFDMSSSTPSLWGQFDVAPSSTLWADKDPKGFQYKDKFGAASDGVTKVQFKTGESLKSKVKFSAKGTALTLGGPVGAAYFNQNPNVVVQLIGENGSCWTSSFAPEDTTKNEAESFKASVKP